MKIYTEEELRKHLYNHDERFFEELTPIELPTDEDIEEECRKFPFDKHVDAGMYNEGINEGFYLGAEYIKKQLLNQNK